LGEKSPILKEIKVMVYRGKVCMLLNAKFSPVLEVLSIEYSILSLNTIPKKKK